VGVKGLDPDALEAAFQSVNVEFFTERRLIVLAAITTYLSALAPPSREEGLREAATAIDRFNRSIDSIEVRCMAADGPVTPTLEEMTDAELADIWADLQTIRRALSHANGGE
jgi:hypothetical protein